MTPRFFRKNVVILGGTSGIGLASARAFVAEGAQVVITGRDANALRNSTESIGPGAIALRSDISDLVQIRSVFSEIQQAIGHIDVLFVNAGILTVLPIESVSEAAWDMINSANLKGVFFSVQAALPLMAAGSNIILNSSGAAHKGEAGVLLYASTKAGVRALGRSLAGELVGRGIRVNVVSPGLILTPIFQRAERVPPLPGGAIPALLEKMSEVIPMKRAGTPEEVAAAVLFLASDAASYITGIELPVDGGATSL